MFPCIKIVRDFSLYVIDTFDEHLVLLDQIERGLTGLNINEIYNGGIKKFKPYMIEDMQFELILQEPIGSIEDEISIYQKKLAREKELKKLEKKERKARRYLEALVWHSKVVVSVVELYHFLFSVGFSLPTIISGSQQVANLLLVFIISG